MNALLKGFTAGTTPTDRAPPWQWCEKHLYVDSSSPMPGRWRSDNSPWVRPLMEDFANNAVREIAAMCSAQSAKTQTFLNCACWAVSEDPGPALWVMAAKDEAGEFLRDRVGPTFDNCRPVAARMRGAVGLSYEFDGMPFYFTGAGSKSKLQSKPIRWLFLDEVRNYPPGALETVLKRTRAFWNSRRVMVSTPALKDDAVHRAFQAGDQRVWHMRCPNCKSLHPLKFELLKWDTNETTKPEGKWNFDALAETIRLECPTCRHEVKDNPLERRTLAREGRFVAMNPNAPKSRRSYHWNALLPTWVPWRSIVEEFIAARAAARAGSLEPLKTFINETLGEPRDDELGVIEDFAFLEQRKADYEFNAPWAEEIVRFMAADKQSAGGEHYWWLVRAFGLLAKSRLIAYGRANTRAELLHIARFYNVKMRNCLIDSGYKANEVYRFCAETHWKAMKGDDAEFFLERDPDTKETFRQCWTLGWAQPEGEAPRAGMLVHVRLFRWSNPWVKDLLAEYTTGLVGEWTIPAGVGKDYMRQMSAEVREQVEDTKGRVQYVWKQKLRDNHLLDDELMILVAVIVTGIIKQRRPANAKRPPAPKPIDVTAVANGRSSNADTPDGPCGQGKLQPERAV